METKYLSVAETAKLIRGRLKEAFPGQKFYVQSETYSGGGSVDVYWMDGPTEKDVEAEVGIFAGRSFDGMIDLAYSHTCWMLPDGTVQRARSSGSAGSGGVDPGYDYPQPHPEAQRVHFGANYVFCRRAYSRGLLDRVVEEMGREWPGIEPPELYETSWFVGGKEKGRRWDFSHRERWEDTRLFCDLVYQTAA